MVNIFLTQQNINMELTELHKNYIIIYLLINGYILLNYKLKKNENDKRTNFGYRKTCADFHRRYYLNKRIGE